MTTNPKTHPRRLASASASLCLAALLLTGCGNDRNTPQSLEPHSETAPQPQTSIYNPAYLDKSESLYRYNDPERGITSMAGIDVSGHQGNLDWNFWKESGVQFAFIRAGYRGYGNGALKEDSCYKANLTGAKAVGLKCGVYFYSQAITAAEAREEAAYLLHLLDGADLELPVVFDWEIPATPEARTWELPPEIIQECAVAFCEEIRTAGYIPMLYANGASYYTYRADPRLDDVDIWYAQYTDGEPDVEGYSIWQYTESGSVNGSGAIDLNLAYLNPEGDLLSAAEIAALQS